MTWVWANSPYSGERLLLHLALADFANDEGICFPSHGTLAKKARCSTGWVSKSIRQMIADGLIEIVEQAGNGRGKVGRYRLLKGGTEFDLSEQKGSSRNSNRSNLEQSDTYLLNRQEPSDTSEDFERLWKCYPRKTAKGAARRAFDRVMRRTDAPNIDDLIAAVGRYGEQFTSGKSEQRFCAYLATWLNSERWLDEILPAQTQQISEPKSGEIRTAESLASAFVHTGRSEEELLESVSPYSAAARQAALDLFRELKAGKR